MEDQLMSTSQKTTERFAPCVILIALILVIMVLFINVGEQRMEQYRQAETSQNLSPVIFPSTTEN